MEESIPAGYQIQITSWENDADNYNTKILSGLTKEDAKFYIEFAKLFKTPYHDEGGLAANASDYEDVKWPELIEAYKAVCDKYLPSNGANWGDERTIKNAISTYACQLLGSSEHYQFRVYDGYVAYLFTTEIKAVKL